jgi:hypothetical protein
MSPTWVYGCPVPNVASITLIDLLFSLCNFILNLLCDLFVLTQGEYATLFSLCSQGD